MLFRLFSEKLGGSFNSKSWFWGTTHIVKQLVLRNDIFWYSEIIKGTILTGDTCNHFNQWHLVWYLNVVKFAELWIVSLYLLWQSWWIRMYTDKPWYRSLNKKQQPKPPLYSHQRTSSVILFYLRREKYWFFFFFFAFISSI